MLQNNKRIIIIVIVLLISNVFFAFKYTTLTEEIKDARSNQVKVEANEKIINFASLFIKKVLQANTEVDFETRLSLENAVRELKDEEVMAEWQNFVASKTELEAQNSVKKLLGILIDKVQK